MRRAADLTPANDLALNAEQAPANDFPPGFDLGSAPDRRARRRADTVSSALFAGSSIALFVILLGFVFAATVLYYRWH
jgi:hypothetical protein